MLTKKSGPELVLPLSKERNEIRSMILVCRLQAMSCSEVWGALGPHVGLSSQWVKSSNLFQRKPDTIWP